MDYLYWNRLETGMRSLKAIAVLRIERWSMGAI